jgi:anti-sigma regulatory factor (Ser/Thr protein kinase)
MAIRLNPSGVSARQDGSTVHWHIEPELSSAGIRQTQHWLRAILASRDVVPARIGEVELIAEELLTNVVRAVRAEPQSAQHLSVGCALSASAIVMTFIDDGPRFDPLAHESPDLDADIADRAVGGLGVHIVRQLADSCRYSHIDGRNILEIHLARA